MILSPKRIAAWYRHPDRELLRREVTWTLRWLMRPPGVLWLALIIVLSFVNSVMAAMQTVQPGAAAPLIVVAATGLIAMILVLTSLGLWFHFVQTRSLGPLEKRRLEELMVTAMDGRTMWPALLAAPITLQAVFGLVGVLSQIVLLLWPGERPSVLEAFGGPQTTMDTWIVSIFEPLAWLFPAAAWGFNLVWNLALTAFTVRLSMPEGGTLRVVGAFILGALIMYTPPTLLVVGLMFGAFYRSGMFSGSGSNTNFMQVPMLSIMSLYPLTLFAMALLLAWISLRGLRSEKTWRKLMDYVERP